MCSSRPNIKKERNSQAFTEFAVAALLGRSRWDLPSMSDQNGGAGPSRGIVPACAVEVAVFDEQRGRRVQPILNVTVDVNVKTKIVSTEAERKLIDDTVNKPLRSKVQAIFVDQLGRGYKIHFTPAVKSHADSAILKSLAARGAIVQTHAKRPARQNYALFPAILVKYLHLHKSDQSRSPAVLAGGKIERRRLQDGGLVLRNCF